MKLLRCSPGFSRKVADHEYMVPGRDSNLHPLAIPSQASDTLGTEYWVLTFTFPWWRLSARPSSHNNGHIILRPIVLCSYYALFLTFVAVNFSLPLMRSVRSTLGPSAGTCGGLLCGVLLAGFPLGGCRRACRLSAVGLRANSPTDPWRIAFAEESEVGLVFVQMENRVAVAPCAPGRLTSSRGLSTESSQAVASKAARISPWLVACDARPRTNVSPAHNSRRSLS